jgi:transmembrane sensor
MHDSIQIEEIAAGWLARRDRGHWSDADQAELTAWLDSCVAHRIAYIRLEAAWQRARRLSVLKVALPPGELPSLRDWSGDGSGNWKDGPISRRQPLVVCDSRVPAPLGTDPTEQ